LVGSSSSTELETGKTTSEWREIIMEAGGPQGIKTNQKEEGRSQIDNHDAELRGIRNDVRPHSCHHHRRKQTQSKVHVGGLRQGPQVKDERPPTR